MMPDDMDGELRARFARLREEERTAARASRLATRALTGRPRHPARRPYRVAATLAAAAAIVVAVLSVADRESSAPREAMEQATLPEWTSALEPLSLALGSARRTPLQLAWRTPTDVLLDTPGRELLRDIPSLGVSSLGSLAGSAPRRRDHARPSADSTPSRATPRSPT